MPDRTGRPAPARDESSGGDALGAQELLWRPAWPISLRATLAPLAHGPGDPTLTVVEGTVWWASRAGAGTVTLALDRAGDAVRARAWGAGADETLARLGPILGAGDDLAGFDAAAHPVMAAAFPLAARWRMLRTERVVEALVPAILEQRVTGIEAKRAWRILVRTHGEPAPGPAPGGLRVPPTASSWSRIPSWEWHRAGVDPGRARTIMAAAQRADALERLSSLRPAQARTALATLSGVGVWTAAEVAVRAWGDADAVSFGDFHLARDVVWALTGRFGGTDEELAEVLVPWAGQRARAARLIRMHAGQQPRRGPRAAITDHRRW